MNEEGFDAPRDDLVRMVKGQVRTEGDGNTLVGYFTRFNSPTIIDSWEGNFKEIWAPGSLNRTIKNNRANIKVLFNHGMDPSIGDKPLGRASIIQADEVGGYAEVPLSATSYNEDIKALLRDQAIDGMSVRFSVPKGGDVWEYPDKGLPIRTITEAKLYEFGPVTFPAYSATSVGVRSREEFSIWRSLDRDKQAELFRIITSRSSSLAYGTDDDEPEDPDEVHSSALTRRALLVRRFDLLRGDIQCPKSI